MIENDNVFFQAVLANAAKDNVVARAAQLREVLTKDEPQLSNGEICSTIGLFTVEAIMMIAKASSKHAMGITDDIRLTRMEAATVIAKEATDAIHRIVHDLLLTDAELQPQQEGAAV